MIEQLFTRTVVILRGTEVPTGYGNATKLDWTHPTPNPTVGWLGPYSGESENAKDRDEQMADATVYLPAGTDITGLDRVQIDAVTYQVTGVPSPPFSPRGAHHIEADLKIVKG